MFNKIGDYIRTKLDKFHSAVNDNQGLFQRGHFQPLEDLRNNPVAQTWTQSFTQPQAPQPITNLTQNLSNIVHNPGVAQVIPSSINQKTIELGKRFGGEVGHPAVGELIGRTAGGLEQGLTRALTTPFTNKPALGKLADVTSGIGSTALAGESVALGAINPVFTTIGSLVGKQRLPTKDELMRSYSEGIKFGSEFGPVSKVASPVTTRLLSRFNPETIKTSMDVAKRLTAKGLSGGSVFGTYGYLTAKKGQRKRSAVDNAIQGALFDMGLEVTGLAGGKMVKDIKNIWSDIAKMTPEERKAFSQGGYIKPDEFLPKKGKLTAPIELLVSHEGAPDRRQVAKIKKDIQSGKRIEPIKVIREGDKYGIEDGKHRFQAFKEMGIKEVPIKLIEERRIKPQAKGKVNIKITDQDVLEYAQGGKTIATINKIADRLGYPQGEKRANDLSKRLGNRLNELVESGRVTRKVVEDKNSFTGLKEIYNQPEIQPKLKVKPQEEVKASIREQPLPQQQEKIRAKLPLNKQGLKISEAKLGVGQAESLKPTAELPLQKTDQSSLGNIVPQKDKYAFNINKNRLKLNPKEKAVLDRTINAIKPELEKTRGKPISKKEVLQAAKESDMLRKTTTREETLRANAQLLKARQKIVSLDKDISSLVSRGDTKQAKDKMIDFIESLKVVSSEAADRGRKLQSLAIGAEDESTRQTILKRISKVSDDTDKIAKEALKVDWNNANSIYTFYRKYVKPTKSEILDEYRYNNMLSSPRTHLRNAFSNMIQTFITRPATLLAQGKVKQTGQYYKGAFGSFDKAVNSFVESFKGTKAIEKPDIAFAPTGKLPRFLTIPTRAMEAGDKFFSTLIESGELARGATPEEAAKTSAYSLFRQGLKPEGQGKLLNAIDSLTSWTYNAPKPVRWFVPFIRTPMNFAKQWLEYSPAGSLTAIGAKNKKEQLAKATLGSMITAIGAKLAMDNRTTWAAPTDKKEKELFYASGKKPFSFKVGDKWVSMMYAGPFALSLALPAAAKYYNNTSRKALTDTQLQKLGKVSSSMAQFLSGQTFMSGLNNFVRLASGDVDYSFAKNMGYTAGQVIPMNALQRYISTILDPVYRESRTFTSEIKKSIPLLSKTLKPYTTPTGEPSRREPTNYFTPYDITTEKPAYNPLLQQRRVKLQQNALVNQAKKKLAGNINVSQPVSGNISTMGGVYLTANKLGKFTQPAPTDPVKKAQWQSDKFKAAHKVYSDDTLDDQTKEQLISTLKEDSRDIAYYDIATSDRSVRRAMVDEALRQQGDKLSNLAVLRRQIRTKRILTSTIIKDLVDEGVLTYQEGKYLRSITDIDKKSGKAKARSSKGRKPKKLSVGTVSRGSTPKIPVVRSSSGVKLKKVSVKFPKKLQIRQNVGKINLKIPKL